MMTHLKTLFAVVLLLLGAGRVCAADATFTVVFRDHQEERDKKLVEAFDLTLNSTKDTGDSLIRPSKTNRVHDTNKATLTIETQYGGVPEGEYEVQYWIPALAFVAKPYMEKFQMLPSGHFRKTLEFSTRKVVLKYQIDKKVREHIRGDEGLPVTIHKIKDGPEKDRRSLEYRYSLSRGNGDGETRALPPLWLIPDGEYVIKFAPVWGHPMRVPFRVVDGKTIPEVVTFSDANRVRDD